MFPYILALIFYCFIATTSCVAVAIYMCFSTYVSIYFSPNFLSRGHHHWGFQGQTNRLKHNQKRNRKKRKIIYFGLWLKQKRSKNDDDDTKEIWNKFLAKRAFDQGFKIEGESQPWVYPLPTPPTFFSLTCPTLMPCLMCCQYLLH